MAKITVNIQGGALGRQSANTDTWGGLFVEMDVMPATWAENEVKRIFKVEDLLPYGITANGATPSLKLAYWHVSEAFRISPNATLYIQLSTVITSTDVIVTAFKNAENRLRLFGFVFATATLSDALVGALDTSLDTIFTSSMQPARAVACWKKDAADAIPDFSAKDYYRVMVDIANDLSTVIDKDTQLPVDGIALSIFNSALGMCGAAGTFLGQMLLLSVHQKPSWRSFPVNGGERWAILGDINGDSVENKTETEIEAYTTQGVSLMVRTLRLTEAFIANSRTAGAKADDYAIINNGRVIDKAIVLTYDALVNSLDGPVYVDPDSGKLAPESIALFEQLAYDNINTNMVVGRVGNSVEVSVDIATGSLPQNAVYIDPNQNILSTEQLTVQVRIVPVGSANEIIINIGLAATV